MLRNQLQKALEDLKAKSTEKVQERELNRLVKK